MSTSYCGITARKNAWPCENNVLKLPRNWQMFWRKSTRISRTCINIFVERMVKQFSTWFNVLCEELWTSQRIHCDLHYSSTPYSASVNYKMLNAHACNFPFFSSQALMYFLVVWLRNMLTFQMTGWNCLSNHLPSLVQTLLPLLIYKDLVLLC